MSEEEKTDQEAFQESVRLIKERDGRIETLEKQVKELTEAMKNNKTEADKAIVGECAECGHALTAAEARGTICPHCLASKIYKSSHE